MKTKKSITQTVTFLNELLALDPWTVQALIEQRVQCNQKLAEHPTVQVTTSPASSRVLSSVLPNNAIALDDSVPTTSVGVLGILNGLFGEEGKPGNIVAVYTYDEATGSHRLLRFEAAK